ncbi:hypothetical protein [Paenibacillus arenosi]|uniref:Uncharacterized protein n=1 Tax=Paenibacillus arenosi TaxID=2774142 RepID=A0ABR9AT27_9BACL|nr:hypothetical protein [Paenibacillus arenosi]MBD8497266.1 hypothetical protein [Paenibacillus arenosi]
MSVNNPIGEYDFVIQSKDSKSKIIFTFVELEVEHLSSINYIVNIIDRGFSGEVDVWIEQEVLNDFIEKFKEANNKRAEVLNLRSMSPEEMEVRFISQKNGRCEIAYSVKRSGYSENTFVETLLKGAFEMDSEFLHLLEEKMKEINKMLRV